MLRASAVPRLSEKNRRDITWAANLLEVKVETFINWILADECQQLRDRDSGLMGAWVKDLLKYDSPEEEARVNAAFSKWLTGGPAVPRQKNRKAWAAGEEGA